MVIYVPRSARWLGSDADLFVVAGLQGGPQGHTVPLREMSLLPDACKPQISVDLTVITLQLLADAQ